MIKRWRRLSTDDRRHIIMLAALLPLVNGSLHLFGIRRTRRWLLRASRPSGQHSPAPSDLAAARRLAALASRLGRAGGHQGSCLRQALSVEFCLRRRGLPAELRIAPQQRGEGGFEAHAWVEMAGTALTQPATSPAIDGVAKRLR